MDCIIRALSFAGTTLQTCISIDYISVSYTHLVLRGMDVLMQIREEKEEARYRQLDESIRAHQKKRKMVAAAREETEEEPRKRKFPFFW